MYWSYAVSLLYWLYNTTPRAAMCDHYINILLITGCIADIFGPF